VATSPRDRVLEQPVAVRRRGGPEGGCGGGGGGGGGGAAAKRMPAHFYFRPGAVTSRSRAHPRNVLSAERVQ
jgi:hypothetical protein